jgi:hypothetical protein
LYIHAPLLDPTINFDYGDSKSIADLSDSVCISDFRFCKDHLQKIADLLWPLMNVYLLGEKNDIKVENGYRTTYKTGFLIVLISDSVLQSNASLPIQSGFIF